jgi:hypothetical protein
MARSVATEWSCGCSDVYNFDMHEGGSYICNRKPGECVRKYADELDSLILIPLPPGDPD